MVVKVQCFTRLVHTVSFLELPSWKVLVTGKEQGALQWSAREFVMEIWTGRCTGDVQGRACSASQASSKSCCKGFRWREREKMT